MDKYTEKWKKEKFLELHHGEHSKDVDRELDAYTIDELRAMRELAELNIIPDERFSDMDCCLWSFFREGCV